MQQAHLKKRKIEQDFKDYLAHEYFIKLDKNLSVFETPQKSTSHNGHQISLIKSAFQKYIRRGNFEKSLYFILQMYMIHDVPARTNLKNRLVVIISEDISFGEWHLLKRAEDLLFKNNIDNLQDLVELVYLLCRAKKSRVICHVISFYGNEKNKEEYPERFPEENSTFREIKNFKPIFKIFYR